MFLRRLAVPAALIATLCTHPAHADDRATAQELFQQAKDLMGAGKIAEACAKFAAAADLSQTVGVRLNLAACYEKIGRTASAWTRYDEALTIAERSGDSAAASLARAAQAAVTPRLSYVSVTVTEATAVLAGLEVTRDGQKVPQAAWGVPVPVDPGEHSVAATAPGHKAWSGKASVVGAGSRTEIAVPLLEVEVAAPPVAPGPMPANDTQPAEGTEGRGLFSGPGGTQRTIAVVSAGAGVVALGVGSIFGLQRLSKKSAYEQHLGANGQCLDLQCQTSSQSAVSAGNVATVGFIAGGALVACGVALWFTAPSSKPAVSAALVPMAGPGGAGMGVGGSW
jgi:hypothetical protein